MLRDVRFQITAVLAAALLGCLAAAGGLNVRTWAGAAPPAAGAKPADSGGAPKVAAPDQKDGETAEEPAWPKLPPQEVLPFPPTPSASVAGRTMQDSVYKHAGRAAPPAQGRAEHPHRPHRRRRGRPRPAPSAA